MAPASPVTAVPNVRYTIPSCPASCSSISSCATCGQQDGCTWAETLNLCIETSNLIPDTALGQWFRHDTDGTCPQACTARSDCSSCLSDERCGWCSDLNGSGICMDGDGRGSYNTSSQCHRQMDVAGINTTATRFNPAFSVAGRFPDSSVDGPWHYFACPDNDECLSSASCSPNANCTNIHNPQLPGFASTESYSCEVRRCFSVLQSHITMFGCCSVRQATRATVGSVSLSAWSTAARRARECACNQTSVRCGRRSTLVGSWLICLSTV